MHNVALSGCHRTHYLQDEHRKVVSDGLFDVIERSCVAADHHMTERNAVAFS